MSKTEELLRLAEAATPGPWKFVIEDAYKLQMPSDRGGVSTQMCDEKYYPWVPKRKEDWEHIAAANPATIKQLVELCRLQHELILEYSGYNTREELRRKSVVAAYERFEKGE